MRFFTRYEESALEPLEGAAVHRITKADLRGAWHTLNSGGGAVDLIALGSPHFSYEETAAFAALMGAGAVHRDVQVMITLGRDVFARAEADGLVARLHGAGVQFHQDLCWCSIVEPMFPVAAQTVMTNSGKYAHYAPGLSGRAVRFGGLAACAAAAKTGQADLGVPEWLG